MLWNTFDTIRPTLETQYKTMKFDRSDGILLAELERRIDAYCEEHRDQPLIVTRARTFCMVMELSRLDLDPDDWFVDHLEGRYALILPCQKRMDEQRRKLPRATLKSLEQNFKYANFISQLDISHTSPDWECVLRYGPAGLRDRALEARNQTKNKAKKIFYACVAEVYGGMLTLIRRFARLARKQGAIMQEKTLKAIARRPPQTFYEALQLALLYDTCQETEFEYVRSQGLFDHLFIRFYRQDLQRGILTRKQAKELMKFFWTKFYAQMFAAGKNIGFGGQTVPGGESCNELTEIAFEIHRELNHINPKLTFRVHSSTPDKMLRQVTDCVRNGQTAIVFNNDDLAFEMFRKSGRDLDHDSGNYQLIGCYEPAIMGREMSCSMAAWGSLASPLEAVFNRGCTFAGGRIGPDCPLPADYPMFEAEYLRQLDHLLQSAMRNTIIWERRWPKVNPAPLLSGTMTDCINSGRDISEAGTRYNSSGVMCAGLGTVVDSLAAVKMLVDERKLCTMAELGNLLMHNWQGNEQLRLIARKRAPKWGNHDAVTDGIARRVLDAAARRINQTPNERGGRFHLGLWSIDSNFAFGKNTAATPDGRLAGDPLSRNTGSTVGMDKNGVLALMNSVAGLNLTQCHDGTVLDVMLHPSAVSGGDGADVLARLIRGFFAAGGMTVQFNIMSADELIRAQQSPEQYPNLQVRVCGWNNQFVRLSTEEQNAFIAQAEAIK